MAVLIPYPRFRAFDANGNPLSGGKVYTYSAGTSTPKSTYTTQSAGVSNSNPVILDSQGYADIWGLGSYKLVIKDSNDSTISTTDNVTLVDSATLNNFIVTASSTPSTTPTVDALATDGMAIGNGAVVTSTATRGVAVGKSYVSGSDAYAVQIGDNSSSYGAQGTSSFAQGFRALASGSYAFAYGPYSIANLYGEYTFSSGTVSAVGDALWRNFILRTRTTNATGTEMFLDFLNGIGGTQRMVIPSDTTWVFDILVVARRTDADNESSGFQLTGVIDNNAGTVALVGSVNRVNIAEDTVAWDIAATADNTNKALILTATGEAAKTINWVAHVRLVHTTG